MIVLFERFRAILRAEDPASWRKLGIAYGRSQCWQKALAALDHALALAPHDSETLEAKGDIYIASGSPDLASACYHDSARLDLRHCNPQRWNKLGIAYAKLGQRDDAIKAYRKALEYEPKNSAAWRNIITEFCHADSPRDIAAVCEEAIRHVPGDANIWYDFGCALEKLSDLKKAASAHAQAWRLRPNFPGPWMHLIDVQVKLKKFDEAAAICHEVAQFKRKDYGHALSQLCEHYIRAEHYAGAKEVIRTLSKIAPGSATKFRDLLAQRTAMTTR